MRHIIDGRAYPSWHPRVLFNRLSHRTIIGPLMGCSCSRCFKHPWRLVYSREAVVDRVRLARVEERLDAAKRARMTYVFRAGGDESWAESIARLGEEVGVRYVVLDDERTRSALARRRESVAASRADTTRDEFVAMLATTATLGARRSL